MKIILFWSGVAWTLEFSMIMWSLRPWLLLLNINWLQYSTGRLKRRSTTCERERGEKSLVKTSKSNKVHFCTAQTPFKIAYFRLSFCVLQDSHWIWVRHGMTQNCGPKYPSQIGYVHPCIFALGHPAHDGNNTLIKWSHTYISQPKNNRPRPVPGFNIQECCSKLRWTILLNWKTQINIKTICD